MFKRLVLATVVLSASVGCAAKTPAVGSVGETAAPVNRDRTLITKADFDANPSLKAGTALEAIRVLRPQFFNDRGTQTIMKASDPEAGKVHASVNGGRIISIDELKDVHANEVIEVRFLNAGQAMQKFGTAARSGPIILVTTTKG